MRVIVSLAGDVLPTIVIMRYWQSIREEQGWSDWVQYQAVAEKRTVRKLRFEMRFRYPILTRGLALLPNPLGL